MTIRYRYIRRLLYRYNKINYIGSSRVRYSLWPVRVDLRNAIRSFFTLRKQQFVNKQEFGLFNSYNQKAAILRDVKNVNLYAFWETASFYGKLQYISSVFAALIISLWVYARCRVCTKKKHSFANIYLVVSFVGKSNFYNSLTRSFVGKTIHFSSDHQGPIFEMFNRECVGITRVYHQHGVLLSNWPENDYEFYVTCKLEHVKKAPVDKEKLFDAILFFNSVQSLLTRLKALRAIRRRTQTLAVQYHPRRKPNIVERVILWLFSVPVLNNDDANLFIARKNFCANSGILKESFDFRPQDTVWIRSIEPVKDFYELSGKVEEMFL